jgi:toluene monooxygenase system ferredoxin subunit
MAFEPVLSADELWKGEMRGLVVGGQRVLVVRTEDEVCAYEDRCAHLGVPLSQGKLEGGIITCAAHHYQYDACTGRGVNPERGALRRFPVELAGGEILIDVTASQLTGRPVGPVLEANEIGRAIAAAILMSNPAAAVEDRGAYLRVSVPERCLVTREAIETQLGKHFELPRDLELVMPAFQGLLRMSEAGVEWSFSSP